MPYILKERKSNDLTRRMQATVWGCGGTRKIIRLFELTIARS